MRIWSRTEDWRYVSKDLHSCIGIAAKATGMSVTEAQAKARRVIQGRAGVSSTRYLRASELQDHADRLLYEVYELGLEAALGMGTARPVRPLETSVVYGDTVAHRRGFSLMRPPVQLTLPSRFDDEDEETPPARRRQVQVVELPQPPAKWAEEFESRRAADEAAFGRRRRVA